MALSRTQTTDQKSKLGRYELLRELTQSGVGTSWLARPTGETFEVTLLKVHRHMAKSPTSVEGLLAAAQRARKFSHDNVAAVLDAGVVDSEPFVVFEYVGESLASLLKAAGPNGLPIPIAMRIGLDILEGMAAAHTNDPPLGHGELGPWCVYVGSDGVARVGGFGVDQAVWRFGAHYVKNMERLSYAAPERVKSMSSTLGQELSTADEESDLFSAAVLLFELLTRQRLFASKMEAAVVQKVLSSPIPTAQSFRPEIPLEVSDALKNALVRDRSERIATFEDFIVALEGAGPDLIATNEAVAEMIAVASAAKAEGARPAASPGAPTELVSSAGTPGAATKPAPVPGRATLMFDEAKDLLPPAVAAAAKADDAAKPADKPAESPKPGAVDAKAPPRAANGTGALRPRARTLMGFGALKPGSKESPAAPNVAPTAGAIPAPRSSSIELEESDLDVEIADPLALPTQVVDLPPVPTKAAPPAAASAAPKAPPAAPPKRPPPARRAATLLGIQAPDGGVKVAAGDISDDPTNKLEDESTTADGPSGELAKAIATAAKAPTDQPAADKSLAEKQNGASAKVAAMRAARDGEGTPHSPVSGSRTLGQRSGLTAEMLRTGATLTVSGTAYQLIAPVARGGMATVWAAREAGSRGLEKMVGIKTMLPELSDDADFESMFLDEARVTAKIRHENVATIIDLGQEGDLLYLVMEWVDGETVGTLQRSARAIGGIPTAVIVRIAEDICAGLHEAHELADEAGHHLEVVHRDISPANVLVGRDGTTKIVDFGIAKSKGRLHVTKVGAMVKGKTPYLSPEQIGGLAIDRRSDLFSLGALLYVMATGLHPFRGETELSTIENIAIKAPVPLKSIVPDIDPGFEQIVLRLLEKDPKKRFQNAREVKEALLELDKKLPKPATRADVASFVEKVIGDKLDQRREMLVAGLQRIERGGEAGPAPEEGRDAEASASALKQVLDKVRQSQPDALDAFSLGGALGASKGAAPQGDAISLDILAPPAKAESPSGEPTGAESSASASLPLGGDPVGGGLPGEELGAVPESEGTSEAAEPQKLVFNEDSIAPPPATQSNTKRLVVLVVVGLVIGLAIVAGLEFFRGDTPTPTPSAQPSAPPPAKASSGPAPVVTAPPTAVPSAEPAPTASPSATADATATAEPTNTPTATPEPPATTPPSEPTGKPPTGATGKPPTGKPPTGKLPSGPVKPKTPKYNPPTI